MQKGANSKEVNQKRKRIIKASTGNVTEEAVVENAPEEKEEEKKPFKKPLHAKKEEKHIIKEDKHVIRKPRKKTEDETAHDNAQELSSSGDERRDSENGQEMHEEE